MEHMQDIGQFFEELMRVSSSGYLAAPSYLREHAFGWPYHRWLITVQDDVLLCAKKPESQTPPHGMLMHYFAATNREFKRFLRTLPTSLLHVQYPWTGKIHYRIVDALEFPNFSSYEKIEAYLHEQTATARQRQKIKAWVLRNSPEWLGAGISRMRQTYHDLRRHKSRRQVDLKSLLACPVCKVSLLHEKQRCVCSQCDRHYPIVDGIPVFLLDESLCPTSRPPLAA
jgi:uncharacterized protein YbaR (Trm112 family)